MGSIGGGDRTDQPAARWCATGCAGNETLEDTDYQTGGPARYYNVAETGQRIGFITPMTRFCGL